MLILVPKETVSGLLRLEVNNGPAVPGRIVWVLVTAGAYYVHSAPVTDTLMKPRQKYINNMTKIKGVSLNIIF